MHDLSLSQLNLSKDHCMQIFAICQEKAQVPGNKKVGGEG